MAIDAALVGARGTSATNTVSTTAGASVSGDGFLIFCSFDPGVTQNTPTDSVGNTYTIRGSVFTSSGGGKMVVYGAFPGDSGFVGSSGSHTATMTFSAAAFPTLHLIRIPQPAVTPFDVFVTGNDSATPYTLASGTLGQANEVVLAMCAHNPGFSTGTYSSSNFTVLSQEPDSNSFWTSAVAKLVVSSTSSVTPSFTTADGLDTASTGLLVVSVKEGTATVTAPPGFIPQPGPGLQGPASPSRFQKLRAGNATASVTLALTGVTGTGSVGTVSPSSSISVGAVPKPGPGVSPFNNNQFLPGLRNPTVSAASAVSLALTGVTGTGSVGSVSVAVDKALTGNSATGSAGTVSAAVDKALTGNSATSSVGTVSVAVSTALTGNTGTGSVGTLGANVAIPLTGVTGTGAVGNVSADGSVTLPLTGVSATGSTGTLSAAASIALTGTSATGSAGSVAQGVSLALSGTTGTGSIGSVGAAFIAALTGNTATGSVGTLAPQQSGGSVTIALTGVAATGFVGDVSLPSGGVGGYDEPKRKKKRYIQRVGGQLVVYTDPALTIMDEAEKPVTVRAIKKAANVVKQGPKVAELLSKADYEQMVQLYEDILAQQDEDDIEALLLSL